MALPPQTIPMQWGPGIMHRDPPQYPEFIVPNGPGPQPAQYHAPIPRMSKSQSDSKFRSEQAKMQVERRHNSQGTNSMRTLPLYSATHQDLDDHAANNPPNNQPQDQHAWSHENRGVENYWSQEHPAGGVGWSHGPIGWSHDQSVGASGWPQNQMGGAAWTHERDDYGGPNKPAWPSSLQDSPDHSHHNSLAMEEEEDVSLRKRYPDMEGHLYSVTLKKGKSGLGLSIVANNQAPRGIVIMGVQQGGVADSSGKIKWGDVILEVNDVSVIGKSQQSFQEMLAQAPVSVNLVLVRPPVSATKQHSGNISLEGLAQVRAVTLKREDERGFGLDIGEVQGVAGDKSTLVISKITVGSPADRCGQLQTGDQLISIDGQKILGYSYDKARCLLQQARSHGTVNLIVASSSPVGGPVDSGEINSSKRHAEVQERVAQRRGGETSSQGTVVQRTSNAIVRNRSRCNPLRQSRRQAVNVDSGKDASPGGDLVSAVVQETSTDHTTYHTNKNSHPSVDREGYHQSEKKDIIQGEKCAIIIFKGTDPLGITVMGGADTSLNGVYIQRIFPDSPAAKDERLHVGDRILAIGSHTLENMKKEEVIQAIQQSGPFVHLTILRQPDGAVQTIELMKPDGGGLGLLIFEQKDQPGIYVQDVVKNHAAYTNGCIKVGDRILSINGQDTTTADQSSVVRLLQACKGLVTLTVQHPETAGMSQQSTVTNDMLYLEPHPQETNGASGGFHNPPLYPPPSSVRVPAHDPPPYSTVVQSHPRYTTSGANHYQPAGLETRSPYNADKASVSPLEQGDNGMKKRVIKLRRGPSGLGFTIIGGKGSPQGDLPIYINRVFDEGAAARDGRIKTGNQLLAVNGVNFANVTHQHAADTLKYLQGDVELTVLSSE